MIPIEVTGGIGDLIISLPFIEEARVKYQRYGKLLLYTHYTEIAKHFIPFGYEIRPLRDLDTDNGDLNFWIKLSDVVNFKVRDESLLPKFIRPEYDHWLSTLKVWGPVIASHPKSAIHMAKMATDLGLTRATLPHFFMGWNYRPINFLYDDPFPGRYITIHDGFDEKNPPGLIRSMKSWDMNYWVKFVNLFKAKHPDIHIVQLGGPHSRLIPGVHINRVNMLTFPDSMRYLTGSLVHVDGDSGLVHARHLYQKPSVVIFGPTEPSYYGYPENTNLKPRVCAPCWWMKEDWMSKCVIGFDEPRCMDSLTPDLVLYSVSARIETR